MIFRSFFKRFGTIKQFRLPDLGESKSLKLEIKEATVKKLHVKEGDKVIEFQEIADVATDKLFTTIPSEYTGKITKIFFQEEEACQVGELFLEIEIESDQVSQQIEQSQQHSQQQKQVQQQQNQLIQQNNKFVHKISPSVKRLLSLHNLQKEKIEATGPKGILLKNDIISYINKNNIKDNKQKNNDTSVEINQSTSQKPASFFIMDDIDVTQLIKNYNKTQNNEFIDINSILIKTMSMSIREFPMLNSLYFSNSPYEYQQYLSQNININYFKNDKYQNIFLENTQDQSILDINKNIQNESLEQMQGTISVTLNDLTLNRVQSPQIVNISISQVSDKMVYEGQNLVKKKIVTYLKQATIKIVGDHRVLDGATLARFLKQWISLCSDPQKILISGH